MGPGWEVVINTPIQFECILLLNNSKKKQYKKSQSHKKYTWQSQSVRKANTYYLQGCFDKGPMLKKSTFHFFHHGNSKLINLFNETQFSYLKDLHGNFGYNDWLTKNETNFDMKWSYLMKLTKNQTDHK